VVGVMLITVFFFLFINTLRPEVAVERIHKPDADLNGLFI
jgi:hypothetical protein